MARRTVNSTRAGGQMGWNATLVGNGIMGGSFAPIDGVQSVVREDIHKFGVIR